MALSSIIRTSTIEAAAASGLSVDFAGFDIFKRQAIRTPQTRFDRIG
ncbi:hypothetical protein J2045_004552 [Peteryoungia aggregata LMG 23059]|uniref:Uncharacterized protein n=1 Tax=Peteryoungia aggregata LMG 23059 TaxID=1368425 RepID=A0ABU0GDR2_9HYPH|nr:hypothetical protein [Peteryoungia aggregata LMG 23059]